MSLITRRHFAAGLGSATAWPLRAQAQQTDKVYRIGFLANDPLIPKGPAGAAFLNGLREGGFVEGKNILIDWRLAEGRVDQYPQLAEALVQLRMDLIVTVTALPTLAAKQATSTIPIVMLNVSDPIGQGIIPSLAFPGGNITGLVLDESPEVTAKRIQLLKDAIPQISRVAVLVQPEESYVKAQMKVLERAAEQLQITPRIIAVRQASDIEGAFAGMARDPPDALLIDSNGVNFTNRNIVMQLALRHRLPTVATLREFTDVGGLMSYGANRPDNFRRAGAYVTRILKGAKPADLPVEQPTKLELVINLKTAKALGITIPRDVLLIADDVVE